jgi:unsaturated chondroitin disaccharide hydrolase
VNTRQFGFYSLASTVLLSACSGAARPQSTDFKDPWTFAEQQLTRSSASVSPSRHPRSTGPDGQWTTVGAGDWTSGFYTGCLWLMHEHTGQAAWRTRAEAQMADLESQKDNTRDHDVGFRLLSSYGNGLRLAGTPAYRGVLLAGARSLATRFDPEVGSLRSWSFGTWKFPVIVDNMMNLELLLWAADNGGEPAWRDMAVSHAVRTLENHVRPDGSTYHVVDYDPETGAVRGRQTHQGRADDSTWARGQAWAVYGFTMMHRYTKDPRFLEAATRTAEYVFARRPSDSIPYWDYTAPATDPRDTSAAAITASGLLELSTRVASPAKERYRDGALEILRALSSPAYLAEGSPSAGILLHAVGHKPASTEVDVSIIYGDYYFLEALLRYRRGIP